MLPEINDLVQLQDGEIINIPSKTYKLDVEDQELINYINLYLQNFTFEIEDGYLMENIKNVDTPIVFFIEDGYLIISEGEL